MFKARFAPVTIFPDADGKVRSLPLFLSINHLPTPSFALSMWHQSTLSSPSTYPKIQPKYGTDMRIFSLSANHSKKISAAQILTGEDVNFPPGRFYVIGSSATGLKDYVTTPFYAALPASYLHLHLLYHLLSDAAISSPTLLLILHHLLIAICAVGLAVMFSALRPAVFSISGMGIILALFAFELWLFYAFSWLVNFMAGMCVLISQLAGMSLLLGIKEGQKKRLIFERFSYYLAPEILNKLIQKRTLPDVDGEHRNITAMVIDMRGFTALSNAFSASPEKIADIVNALFSHCTTHITAHHGMIDKFMGDGILALWNVPLDCPEYQRHAVECGKAILDNLPLWQSRLQKKGVVPPGHQIEIGIGVASGPVIVGHFGGGGRLNYTAIGNCINLAARLEALCVQLESKMIIDYPTAEICNDVHFIPCPAQHIKGFNTPQKIFRRNRED